MQYVFCLLLGVFLGACQTTEKNSSQVFNKKEAAIAFELQFKEALADFMQIENPKASENQILEKYETHYEKWATEFETTIAAHLEGQPSNELKAFDKLFLYNSKIHIYAANRCQYAYQTGQGRYYVNIPFGWGNYALRMDSVLIGITAEKVASVKIFENLLFENRHEIEELLATGLTNEAIKNKIRVLHEKNERRKKADKDWINIRFTEVRYKELQDERAFYSRSVYAVRQTKKIAAMLDGLQLSEQKIDTLIRHLHNTSSHFNRDWLTSPRWYIEKFAKNEKGEFLGLYALIDTAFAIEKTPQFIRSIDVFERMSAEDLQNLELLYPDFSSEKVPEIAEYAQQKKPTFIYFKRGKTVDEPIAYYFLFYYLDYIPFYGWHLRDMEVVFPRRFLADLALER